MIRKLIVAMVAAAMLVAMAVPAYAQNAQSVPPNGQNDPINFALNNLEQECEIEQEQNTRVVQSNDQNSEQDQAGAISQGGEGLLVLNINYGDVNQSQSSEQNAENNAWVVPIQANTGDVKCDAAIVQLQDVLALIFGEERNGPPNNS